MFYRRGMESAQANRYSYSKDYYNKGRIFTGQRKTLILILGILALNIIWMENIYAAPRYYNFTDSAEMIGTLNRSASLDADAVFYNPAGTAFMKDGLYLHFSSQTAFMTKKVEDSTDLPSMGPFPPLDDEYNGVAKAMAIPYIYLVYHKNDLAWFGGVLPIGGSGTGDFNDGIPTLDKMGTIIAAKYLGNQMVPGDVNSTVTGIDSIDSEISMGTAYYAFLAGGSVAVNEKVSLSAGYYYLIAGSDCELEIVQRLNTVGNGTQAVVLKSDFEQEGKGFGIQIGMDIRPNTDWNIGMKYEYFRKFELEYNTKRDDLGLFPDGEEKKQTLPMTFNLGVSHMVTPRTKIEGSFLYSLDSKTDWDGQEDNMDNAWSLGAACEYALTKDLKVSTGYLYQSSPYTSDMNTDMEYTGDGHSFAPGATYQISPALKGTFGIGMVHYLEDKNSDGSQTYNSDSYSLGVGIEYKIF